MKIPRHFFIGCLIFIFLGWSSFSVNALAISIPDEKKLGKQFMEMIREQRVILHDPIARQMINTVGRNIQSVLPTQPFDYSFFLINDDNFNAFATPAANIFIHRGLIDALDNIDEFAGIMAHEIAHAASRHVSESIDRAKLVSFGTIAGMLAGILIGNSGGGDAAKALTMGSMAAGQSSMLAYTRENETEADEKAILFLKQVGYNPKGLLSGLTKLRESDYRGVEGIPDYFKTHPGTGKRIIHIAGILTDYTPDKDKKPTPDTFDFEMVKYRLMGLYGDLTKSFNNVENKLEKEPENPALHYGIGLLYARKNQRDLAIFHLQKALSIKIFDPMILVELGRIYIHQGRYEKALDLLQGITEDPVLEILAKYYMAIAQIESGNLISAEKNLKQVLALEEEAYPRAYYHLANIMSQEKNQAMSHYYLGIYYDETRKLKNASHHLKKAVETLNNPEIKKDAEKRLTDILKSIKKKKYS
ncbi:MAG: Zn-dependent protease [Desulfobacteraceae bacterium 4572_89]|nr:MAG: Zn-dependent protease [Desulfobacteraceae bacterium 4572_89]